ncbi:Uncharacterized protein Adt_33672 [Abeliophyllum distichum]|uniref:Uncharacterized protein n=1 Tax=Abeliophyllum distichum TaxID=126358 RepID=A0ABD1QXU4_9LAMI
MHFFCPKQIKPLEFQRSEIANQLVVIKMSPPSKTIRRRAHKKRAPLHLRIKFDLRVRHTDYIKRPRACNQNMENIQRYDELNAELEEFNIELEDLGAEMGLIRAKMEEIYAEQVKIDNEEEVDAEQEDIDAKWKKIDAKWKKIHAEIEARDRRVKEFTEIYEDI